MNIVTIALLLYNVSRLLALLTFSIVITNPVSTVTISSLVAMTPPLNCMKSHNCAS